MKSLALAILLLAGCKTDPPAPAGAASDQSAAKPRSGKVELPTPPPSASSEPAAPSPAPADPTENPPPAPESPPPTDEQRATMSRRRAEAIRNKLDTNGDGKLTVEELKATPAARRIDPEATDTNHDGEISVDELDTMMAKRMGRGMVGRGAFGGVTRGQH